MKETFNFNDSTKKSIFSKIDKYLDHNKLSYSSIDESRPWGGFFVINETDTDRFIDLYFPDYPKDKIEKFGNKLSPKILIVEPNKRLSWQYHNRRAELWRVIDGPVGFIKSSDDNQATIETLNNNQTVQFDKQIRHRLIGLDSWGIVAEIWQHTDTLHPSNEEDIVRLADDYGR